MEGGLTAGFGAKFTGGAGAGPGGLGSGFTIVFGVAAGGGGSVLAGGLAPAGGVTTPGAFPLRGVAGTPDEGVAMLGAAGRGLALISLPSVRCRTASSRLCMALWSSPRIMSHEPKNFPFGSNRGSCRTSCTSVRVDPDLRVVEPIPCKGDYVVHLVERRHAR
jgi:hypothetical protein